MSDGTEATTHLQFDIKAGDAGSDPAEFTASGGRLFFAASGPEGRELWKKTIGGAILVEDIRPGNNSNPTSLVDMGGTLYFRATTDAEGAELWKSHGFAADTELVVNLEAGNGNSSPTGLVASGAIAAKSRRITSRAAERR